MSGTYQLDPLVDRALALIRKKSIVRTPELAQALGLEEPAVDELLEPARRDGLLTTCTVELAGGARVIEYRHSVAGGGLDGQFTHKSNSALFRRDSGEARPPSLPYQPQPQAIRAPAAAPDAAESREEPQVQTIDRITAAFKEHGPMTKRELAQHVKHPDVGTFVTQLADRGVLGRLGGKTAGVIYGLPHQELSQRKSTAPAAPKAGRAKTPKPKPAKRAGGGSAAMRRKRRVKKALKVRVPAKPSRFRPALAADGAILFIGAKGGDFEIPREGVRNVLELTRRLTPDELAAAVSFVERLDKAEVAA